MNEFFKQCLKDLEPLTGHRQLYFLESDLDDGARKLEVLLSGMLEVSKRFHYIPEDVQKKIIRRMMIEDQHYEGLNSRVIYRWLDQNKDKYFQSPSHRAQEEEPKGEPASPEFIAECVRQIQENAANVGNPEVSGVSKADQYRRPKSRRQEWDEKTGKP